SGHATTVLPKSLMNSRRLMGFSPLAENHLHESLIRSSGGSYAPHRSRRREPMSALGQKQTSGHVRVMTALPPIADIDRGRREGYFGPKDAANVRFFHGHK